MFIILCTFWVYFLVCTRFPWRLVDAKCGCLVMEGCGEAPLSSWHLLCHSQMNPHPPHTPHKQRTGLCSHPALLHDIMFVSLQKSHIKSPLLSFFSAFLLQNITLTVLLQCSPLLCQTWDGSPMRTSSSLSNFSDPSRVVRLICLLTVPGRAACVRLFWEETCAAVFKRSLDLQTLSALDVITPFDIQCVYGDNTISRLKMKAFRGAGSCSGSCFVVCCFTVLEGRIKPSPVRGIL